MHSFRRCLVISLALLASPLLRAQTTTTGAITGTVLDPTDAIVGGAHVTITSVETGAVSRIDANGSGNFRVGFLNPGHYRVTVEMAGFSRIEREVLVQAGQVTTSDAKLALGSETQTVNVEDTVPLLQMDNGNVSTTVTEAQIQEIPNPGNDMTYVLQLAPGVLTAGGTRSQYGLPNSSSTYTINGMVNNDPYYNGNSSGATNLLLGSSEVEEATVVGNAYSGQYGGLAGTQVNYITRAGTNAYHGSATYFWTGRALAANSYFNKHTAGKQTPRPFDNGNQWAASLGGPALKDKLFFFINTEGLRVIGPTSTNVFLPSPEFQAATLRNLNARGRGASIPFYQQMFALYNAAPGADRAVPGNPTAAADTTGCGGNAATFGVTNCTQFFQSNISNAVNEYTLATRVDANLGHADRAFIRFSTDHGLQPSTTDVISNRFNAVSSQPNYQGQINETHTFGPRIANNAIISGQWTGTQFGPVNLADSLAAFPTQLGFSDSTITTLGGANNTYPVGRNVTQAQLQDDLSISRGNHTIKLGARWNFYKINDHYFTRGTNGLLTTTIADFFNGAGANGTSTTSFTKNFSTIPNHPFQYWQIGVYAEDEWKATRNLTLTAALRVDHLANPQCLDGCFNRPVTAFTQLNHDAGIPYSQALSVGQKSAFTNLQNLQWQPRASFAYSPAVFHDKTVLRGGFGIFYDAFPAVVLDQLSLSPPLFNSFTVSGDAISPAAPTNLFSDAGAMNTAFTGGVASGQTVAQIRNSLPASLRGFFSPPAISSLDSTQTKLFTVNKWNLEWQQELPGKVILDVNYVGNHGVHRAIPNTGFNASAVGNASYRAAAALPGLPAAVPDTRFGRVYLLQTNGNTSYNGLVVSGSKRFGSTSVVSASWTYSKSLDTASPGLTRNTTVSSQDITSVVNPYNVQQSYAASLYDMRHYFSLNYLYTSPGHNLFYSGWQLSGTTFIHTGQPYSVNDTAATNLISGSGSSSTGANYGGSLLAHYNGSSRLPCVGPGPVGNASVCMTKSMFTNYGIQAPGSATVPQFYGTFNGFTRNNFYGPGYVEFDVALLKNIPLSFLREGTRFEFGAQAFNIANHPNFARPNSNIGSSNFGTITATQGTATSIFGGVGGDSSPRLLEIKGKLIF